MRLQRLRDKELDVWGRSAEIDLSRATLRLYANDDMIQRSFHPAGTAYQPAQVNSGESLAEWLLHQGASVDPPMLACNALHTNFVRGNGFLVIDGRLICKPPGSIPLDGDRYLPLDGAYSVLSLAPGPARVHKLKIRQGSLIQNAACDLAISGPCIVCQGKNTTHEIPVRLPAYGQTLGDEVNFPVTTGSSPEVPVVRTSWTALGINRAGQLLVVSIFAGTPGRAGLPRQITFQHGPTSGLTLAEMAEVLIQLGAMDAILAGGSGDTQQSITGQQTWCARPRAQDSRIQAGKPVRGLGAILGIYRRKSATSFFSPITFR